MTLWKDDQISIEFEPINWIQIGEDMVTSLKEYLTAMMKLNELQKMKIHSEKSKLFALFSLVKHNLFLLIEKAIK